MAAPEPTRIAALPWILKALARFDLAVLGLGALAFVLLFWADGERSRDWTCTLTRREGILLAVGNAATGIAILCLSFLIASSLGIRLELAGEGPGSVLFCVMLFYLGFSSLGLGWKALRSLPSRLLLQVHPVFSALAAVLLLLVPLSATPVRKAILPLVLAGVILLSTILALMQYRRNRPRTGTTERGGGEGPAAPRAPGAETVTAFPRELSARYVDPVIVGTGGLSRVFRARRREDGREVAVKVPLALDETTGKAFLREMQAWMGLSHDNILPILGANILPVPYVEMEFLPRSLEDLEKPVDPETAARIVAGIARGLSYAHARGIVHGDLKPGNILLTQELQPKIGDWGLSKFLGVSTATDVQGFSPRYAAPEQLDPGEYGPVSTRTDIYGLGAVFYELVTGRPPFTGNGITAITRGILHDEPVPPSTLNPVARPVDGIILKCLEKDPGKRYQDARDLERDLVPFTGAKPPGD